MSIANIPSGTFYPSAATATTDAVAPPGGMPIVVEKMIEEDALTMLANKVPIVGQKPTNEKANPSILVACGEQNQRLEQEQKHRIESFTVSAEGRAVLAFFIEHPEREDALVRASSFMQRRERANALVRDFLSQRREQEQGNREEQCRKILSIYEMIARVTSCALQRNSPLEHHEQLLVKEALNDCTAVAKAGIVILNEQSKWRRRFHERLLSD